MPISTTRDSVARELYLDLMKRCLTRISFGDAIVPYLPGSGRVPAGRAHRAAVRAVQTQLSRRQLVLAERVPVDLELRSEGRDWPANAETMIGMRRLDSLQVCIASVLDEGVPGDLIETGAWRGGATIFMQAMLKAYGETSRNVWVADSFEGLPPPNEERYPADRGCQAWSWEELKISVEHVKANFDRYGLLDENVRFLVGWFSETLLKAPIEQLAVLRLDGDMYESTIDAISPLYPKLSVGGYVIVDDFGAVPACKAAIHDYRSHHGITEPIQEIDWTGVFWRRER